MVGPQNLVNRLLREKGRLPPAPKYSSKREHDTTENDESFTNVPTDRPVFTTDCRKAGNDPRKSIGPSVDPREIHHVVVPYGPLCHQRCNDWPPEPQYSSVTRNTSFDDARQSVAGTIQFRRPMSFGSDYSSAGESGSTNRFGRLRRRLRRNGSATQRPGLPPMPPRRGRTMTNDLRSRSE